MIRKFTYQIIFSLFFSVLSFAEGTKEMMPTSGNYGFLQIYDRGRLFATYNSPVENRLYIHICHAGEIIYFGFNQPDNDVYFRLKDPSGNVVMGPSLIPSTGTGFITNYNKAVAGPSQLVGATGYDAFTYTSLVAGDYYIEFNPTSSTTINKVQRIFDLFDFTVADALNNVKPGRLWSYTWDINTKNDANSFDGKMYIYSKDSIVTSVDFNGIQPHGATISANSHGCANTGDIAADRASRVGEVTYPEFKIFLNDPDLECYPTGVFGSFTKPTTITGCDPNNRCINIFVNKPGHVEVLIDVNGVAGFQESSGDILLPFIVSVGQNCIPWNSKDGNGKPIVPNANMSVEVNYSNGVTNLPLYDVESHKNGYIVDLIRPAGPKPKLYWDDSQLNAGTAIDGKVNLTGCSNSTGCHKWKDRGVNTCDDECPETINTWWYPSIITNKFAYPDDLPRADADKRNKVGNANDSTVCAGISQFQLAGQLVNSASGAWSGGNGTFVSSANDVNASYIPTTAEKNAGKVKLTLSSLAAAGCPVATDTLRIFFVPEPKSDAGVDQILCADLSSVKLNGSITNASAGVWSGGSGTISNANALNTTYKPTTAELNSGSVTLALTTVNSSLCSPYVDLIKVDFIKPPTVSAGSDQSICSTTSSFSLNGSAGNYASVSWSGGTGTISNATIVNPVYNPSASEIASGSVKLFLNVNAISPCVSISDDVTLSIIKAPFADAGPDQNLCADPSVNLNGSFQNASAGVWSGGTGTWSDVNAMNAAYIPTALELNSGSVTFTLTTVNSSLCAPFTDLVKINFVKPPSVNAGSDQEICSTSSSFSLSGSASDYASLLWTGGMGTISNSSIDSPVYQPTASEISSGSVKLTLNATALSPCTSVSDEITLSIINAPLVDAGPDQVICSTSTLVNLIGLVGNASGITWSGGSGSFSNAQLANADYNLSASESGIGSAHLILTALGNFPCASATDDMFISYSLPPVVNAGNDMSICSDQKSLSLNGSVSMPTNVVWSGGNGTFLPDNSSLSATYFPSASEAASGFSEIILTTIAAGNCLPEDDTILIDINPLPVLVSQDTLVACNGTNIDLSTSEIINTQYQWKKGNTILSGSAHLVNVLVTSTPEKYFVKATNGFACSSTDSMVVKGIPVPIIILNDTSVCEGQKPLLKANVTNAVSAYSLSYAWSLGTTNLNNYTQSHNATLPGNYFVKVKIADCENTKSALVSFLPNPIDQMPDKVKFCPDGILQTELDAGSASSYLWSTSEITKNIFVNTPGQYSVTVYNSFNCSNTEAIEVLEVCPPKLFISNSFTPNADGKNEKYNVYGKYFTNFKMLIFNRWGEIIFESNNRNHVWDGTYRGEPIPIGMYPWIITYEGDSEEYKGPYQLEGSVTVVR